jgi:hypothetical protein
MFFHFAKTAFFLVGIFLVTSLPSLHADEPKAKPPKPDTFAAPMQGKARLAFCYAPDDGCGRKAADQWCQRKGFKGAKDWVKYPRDAAKPLAGRYLGSDFPCSKGQCDLFESITCRTGPPTFF